MQMRDLAADSRVDHHAWAALEKLLFTPEGRSNAYAYYSKLHALGEEFLTPNGTHVVIGYAALAEMMRSPQFRKNNSFGASQKTIAFSKLTAQQQQELDKWDADAAPLLGSLDPPDHLRIRGLVQRTFTPRHVDQLRPKITSVIDSLLSKIDTKQPADMYAQFGALFAPEIVAELIGLPSEDRAYIAELTGIFMRGIDPGASYELRLASTKSAYEQRQYVQKVIADRRKNPRDDVVTALTEASGDTLSEAELVRLLNILYIGGYETTAHMIGNGLVALLRNPSQFELLKSNPDTYLRPAVEEILRFDGAISLTQVYPVAGATLQGKPADPDVTYLGLLTAANRDPKAYESPDTFVIERKRKPILTFGGGPHFCLGINLAKLELEMVFRELITRFPDMRLAEPGPVRASLFLQQTYETVPVLLQP
jgi:cytochrome P450